MALSIVNVKTTLSEIMYCHSCKKCVLFMNGSNMIMQQTYYVVSHNSGNTWEVKCEDCHAPVLRQCVSRMRFTQKEYENDLVSVDTD